MPEIELLWTKLLEKPCQEPEHLFYEIHRGEGADVVYRVIEKVG